MVDKSAIARAMSQKLHEAIPEAPEEGQCCTMFSTAQKENLSQIKQLCERDAPKVCKTGQRLWAACFLNHLFLEQYRLHKSTCIT